MKKVAYSLLTVLLIGLIVISCKKEDDNAKQLVFSGKLTSSTDCKSNLKSTPLVGVVPDSLSCVEYSFDSEMNKLTLKHINAGFNCCPDSLYCKVELKGDTILIQEFEKALGCHCNCLYDLDIEIEGVDLQKYQIEFSEPYASGQAKLAFVIDLTTAQVGTECVTRTLYPWGISSSD